jgi:hypothetical protein
MDGRSFCPLGDAASWALRSNVKLFRDEFQRHVDEGRCPFEGELVGVAGARSRAQGLGDAGVAPQPGQAIPTDTEPEGT